MGERHGSHNESQINLMGPIQNPFSFPMGIPYGAYIPAHMDLIWDLYTHVVWDFSLCQSSVDYGNTKTTQIVNERERERERESNNNNKSSSTGQCVVTQLYA